MVTLFPCFLRSTYVKYGSDGKASACNAGDLGSILGWGKSPGEGNGNPLQYSCLGNPMDRGSCWTMVHTVAKSLIWLSDFTFTFSMDFPGGSDSKASVYNAGDLGSIPGSGRSDGEGNGNPLQYYCLENPMDRGAWWATVHGVAKSRTRLSDFTFLSFPFLSVK